MTTSQSESRTESAAPRLHWIAAAALAVLALVGGIFLGRTAFIEPEEEVVPFIEPGMVETGFAGNVRLEYRHDAGIMLLHLSDLPRNDEDVVYQVWLIHGANPVSMGVVPDWKSVWAVSGDPETAQTLLITREQGPTGSESPSEEIVVRFDLAEFTPDE